MKRIVLFFLLAISFFTGFAQHKVVSAYYPDWSIYNRKYPPSSIPVNKLDQIISAFVFPFVVNGTLGLGDNVIYRGGAAQKGVIGAFTNFTNDQGVAQTTGLAFVDIWADFQITSISPLVPGSSPTYLSGTSNADQINNWIATPDRNKQGVLGQLINLRLNKPSLHLVTSVGGWTLAQQFPLIADDIQCRSAFAAACGNFCTSFKLDGMDFDWEFPVAGGTDGTETINGNPVPAQAHNTHDPENFVMLAKAVKAVLKPLGITFTIAISQDPHTVASKYIFPGNKNQWTSSFYKSYDGSTLVDWIDYFATMTYDYGGAWLSTTSHQAPLYNSNVASDQDFDMSVSAYMDKILSLGVPPARIYMGVPFYGRGWGGVNLPGPNGNGMYQPASTSPKLVGSWDDPSVPNEFSASFDYGDLKDGKASNAHQYIKDGVGTGNNGFIEYWDSVTKVPFVYNATTGQLISYDNPRSITSKVQYAMSKNLAGVFTWEITQDDRAGSMVAAMYDNAQSYNINISGKILDANGAGIPAVNISLTDGTNNLLAISDNSGVYAYTVPALRNYTLSFGKSSYTFLPSSRVFSGIQKDTVVAVVGSTSAYTLGGSTIFTDGTALSGVTIALNSGSTNLQTTLTAAGSYTFPNIPGGNFAYTLQPISNYYNFTPANYTYTSLNANQSGKNFTGAYKKYTISGTVLNKSGVAIAGQTITLTSSALTTTAISNASGGFSFPNLQAMVDYTIAPQIANNYLLPSTILIKSLAKDSAITLSEPPEIVVFGYVKNGAAALPNVVVSMTNDWQAAWNYGNSRTTDANGFFVFDLPSAVTQLTNFTLTPGAGTYFPAKYTIATVSASLKANYNTQAATLTMALTQPTDSIIYVDANNHIALSATASTDVGTITGVSYAVNGQTLVGANANGNIWQATWTPTALKTQYTITVTATTSGGVTNTITKSVYVGCTANCPNNKPVITLTAPTAAGGAQKTFVPVPVTATITDDGTVASVQFIIDGTTYTPTLSGSIYTYSFTPAAYKSYSIVINATDNNGLISTLTTAYLVNQPSTFTALPTPAIVGYWQNWMSTDAPMIKLKDLVSSNYNVIDVAFAVQQSTNQANLPVFTPDATSYPDVQVFKNEIQLLKNAGKPVVLSLGGETGQFIINSVSEKVAFYNAIIGIVDTYGFDGIDIDFEGAAAKFGETSTSLLYNTLTSTRSKLLIDVLKELKVHYGSSFLLTMAPELAYVQGGIVGYPAPAQGDFLPILYNLQNEIDLLQIQYYNYGSEWWMNPNAQAPKSAELIIHEVEALLTGFKLGGTTNYFPAIPPSKLAIGMPATCSSAGPGYNVGIDTLIRGLEYLRTGVKPAGFLYTLQGGPYLPLRGMMTWSINWDATTDCSHVPYDFANKYYTYFKSISNQPPVVNISSPVNNAVLNTGTTTITVAASDPDGTVASVDFYVNSVKVSTDVTAPYNFTWNATTVGAYILKAIATDNLGLATTSATTNVQVVVAGSPTISLTAPANNAQIMPGTALVLSATAVPSSGSTISKVDFYDGTTLINSDVTSPYNYTWTTATPGIHNITAKATDNSNRTALSSITTITVFVNYAITGTIAKANSTVISGVTVTLAGNNQNLTTTTDANGNYSFTAAISGGNYTITPTATGMIFSPQVDTITNLSSATTGNFTLNEGVFFQGTVLDNKTPKAGIYIYVTDATNWWTTPDIITDANGNFKLLIPTARIGDNFTLELRSWQTWDNTATVQFDRSKYFAAGYTLNSSYQIIFPAFSKAATINFNTNQNTISTTIVTPAQISAAKNATVVLQATATIQTGTITAVSFAIGGQTIAGTLVSGSTYQASWTPATVDSTYSLTVTASGQGIQGAATQSITVNCTGVGCANKPPVIVLSTPVSSSERQVNFTAIPISAQVTDTDGSIASVVVKVDGVNYSPTNNGNNYTYNFTPAAYKVYAIVITATDNLGAVTTINKSYEITAPTPFTPAPSKVVVGYWHNWENSSAPFMPLVNVKNTKYNICVVSFIETANSDGFTAEFAPLATRYPDPNTFIAEIKALKAAGIPVLISIGGQNGHVALTTVAQKAAFRDGVIAIIEKYGFDGLDLDFEGGSMNYGETVTNSLEYANLTSPTLKNTIDFVREVKAHFGNGFIITAAPETYYVQVGYGIYSGGLPGAFLPVIHNIRNILDYIAVQLYNTGSVTATDTKNYNQASPDFLVAMSDMLLNNFTLGTSGTVFPKLRQDQVVIGIPATPSSSPAGGYLNTTKGIMALDYLMKGTKDPSLTYNILNGPYPNLRGVMDWSINWDASTDAGLTPYTFANTYSAYFSGGANQPPVANITAPANSAILTAGANTITVNATDASGTIVSVDFYVNGIKIGTDATAPYSFIWNSTTAGPYQLQAIATDNSGLLGNSAIVNIQVVVAGSPTVTLTAPTNNAQIMPGTALTLSATAAASSGNTVSKVDFYDGTTLLNTDLTAPFAYTWTSATAGKHYLVAKVTDNGSRTGVSNIDTINVFVNYVISGNISNTNNQPIAGVAVTLSGNNQNINATTDASGNYSFTSGLSGSSYTVAPTLVGWSFTPPLTNVNNLSAVTTVNFSGVSNPPPVINITSPANNITIYTGYNTITAAASDAGGSVVSVDFYINGSKVGTDVTSPFNFNWNANTVGAFQLQAIATDNSGLISNSSIINVQVALGTAVSISLTAPANNAQINPGTELILSATATASSGSTVSKVDFYDGTTLLYTDVTSPYNYTWTTASAGTHNITAKITDNSNNTAVSNSNTIVVFVNFAISGTIKNANNMAIAGIQLRLFGNNQTVTTTTDANGYYNFGSVLSGSAYTITPASAAYNFTPQNTTINNLSASAVVNFSGVAIPPPGVNISSPANNTTLFTGYNTLTATVANTGTTIVSVDFYVNGVIVGTDASAPYTFNWYANTAGNYQIQAVATDNNGLVGNSTIVNVLVSVSNSPTVSITSPANNAQIMPGSALMLNAIASASSGRSILKVDFFDGTVLLYSAPTAPYSYNWTTATVGNHTIIAKITDNSSKTAVSSIVTITVFVNYPVSGNISDANNTAIPGVSVALVGNNQSQTSITDVNGNYIFSTGLSGSFYTITPTSNSWAFSPQSNTITNLSAATTVDFSGTANQPPVVSLNTPADNSTLYTGVNNISVGATDADGTIVSVDFYVNGSIVGTDATAPYTFNWNTTVAGAFKIQAIATDNNGLHGSSSVITVQVISANTLPVQLSAFDVQKLNSKARIFWTTAQEINSSYFQVQHSVNGADWLNIHYVKAAGSNNTIINYSVIDDAPTNGVNFYRLKQVDIDGVIAFSEIKAISFELASALEVAISPNPATSFINIAIPGANVIGTKVFLYQPNGILIKQYVTSSVNLRIDVSTLAKGLYLVKVVEGDKVSIKRIEIF